MPSQPDQPSQPDDPTALRFSLTVEADLERAFRVFSEQMATWWPTEHRLNEAPFAAIIVEPRAGGRWYELGTDGSEVDWGVVLGWDPPRHLALSWHLDGNFRYDPLPGRSSRVDIRFTPQADGSTVVDLEHTGLDNHGPTWRRLRDELATPDGWPDTLGRYVGAATG
jgi:uncharacterized protein YndB with AHSA1/START domain